MVDARPIIACWGELVWDRFEDASGDGSATPARYLGGSAAAIAAHLSVLGARARLVSAVGDDDEGEDALHELEGRGLDVASVLHVNGLNTASVKIRLEEGGEPAYARDQRLAWDELDFTEPLTRALKGANGLVFGLFAQGNCLDLTMLDRAIASAGRPEFVACDLNLRRPVPAEVLFQIANTADLIKLNHVEHVRAAQVLGVPEPERLLLACGRVQWIALTRGSAGAELFTRAARERRAGARGLTIVDTVGAGDALMAALTRCFLQGLSPSQALAEACRYAELHLAQRGAMPRSSRFPGAPS
jgi:fructokinase